MYGYIYKTTNLINNKFYIGQHHKKNFDNNYFGSGKLILRAINKYNINNFKCEIIEWCKSQKELNKREIYWIEKLKPYYNISKGGTGGNLGEKVNKKISKTMKNNWKKGKVIHHQNSGFRKGYTPWNKGKKGIKGHIVTPEIREKMSNSLKGRIISLEQRKHQSEIMKGHKCSEETRRKMSEHNCMKNPIIKEKVRLAIIKSRERKRKWIHKDSICKCVYIEEVNNYLNQNWILGRKNKFKKY